MCTLRGCAVALAIFTATTGFARGRAEVPNPLPSAFFVVRATVAAPSKRMAFDEWYHREHLPDAAKAFGVKKARRFWSGNDPSLHQARYEFADEAALERAMNGDALKTLVAEVYRCWPGVPPTPEIFLPPEAVGA